jgi:microcompartment protein CcmL/EutN
MNNSLALLEVKGFCASVSAVDSLLKNSSVGIELEEIKNGNVLLKLKGNLPQINYAINLVMETVNKISSLTNFTVLENLNSSIEEKFFDRKIKKQIPKHIENLSEEKIPVEIKSDTQRKKSETKPKKEKKTSVKVLSEEKKNDETSETSDIKLSTLERLRLEALGKKLTEAKNKEVKNPEPKSSYNVKKLSDLDGLNVHKLRRVARDFEEFPIKGRQISRANRDELMIYFKQILPE